MKVIILNTAEQIGGAAIAAKRLMKALNGSGVQTRMLVRDRQTDDPDVAGINTSWLRKKWNTVRFIWERLVIFIHNGLNRSELFRVSIANTGTDISRHPLVREADLIHLHWINQGFLSISDLESLLKLGKPVVWTMHDMWPVTGICHHARECSHYEAQCGSCFYLNSSKGSDISHQVFLKKKKVYEESQMAFVCCSRWLGDRSLKGSLFMGKTVRVIPNPIDMDVFRKKDKAGSRRLLNLPVDKRLVLFGALNVTDQRKGIDYLIDAFGYMKEKYPEQSGNIELVVFGQVKSEIRNLFDLPIHSMGYLNEEEKIVSLYSAVDLFATTSLEENLPNTIMETMACGTPCVGFNTGGIPEMIDHLQNGYVAEYKNAVDFAEGMMTVLSADHLDQYGRSALEKVRKTYCQPVVAGQYIRLYESMIKK